MELLPDVNPGLPIQLIQPADFLGSRAERPCYIPDRISRANDINVPRQLVIALGLPGVIFVIRHRHDQSFAGINLRPAAQIVCLEDGIL